MAENDKDAGTGSAGDPADDASEDAGAAGSTGGAVDASLLLSRLNGQTAKVGELTNAQKADRARIKELEAALTEAQGGTASADEAAKALVAAKQKELDDERAARRLDGLKGRFPETFTEVGDAAASLLTETQLAALEARLTGDEGEPPTPGRHNESKTAKGSEAAKKEETGDEIAARLLKMPVPGWN